MATQTTTIFNGNLNPTLGSRTDKFNNADYAIIIAPTIEAQNDDFEVDTFLQLEFGNRNRLIPLSPVNLLDTNRISIIPLPFKAGNEFDLYLFLLASEPALVEVIVVSNVDDNILEIKDKLNELSANNSNDSRDVIDTVLDIISLTGGDLTALLPLFGDVISGLDSLDGVELPSLPPAVDTAQEITQFYGL